MKLRLTNRGYTIIELLIATFLTGILTMAGLQYYVHIHNQTLTQEDIGDMQQAARNSLEEMSTTLRMAGYKLPAGHNPFEISSDTLRVYFSGSQPVDTVAYYLVQATGVDDDNPRHLLMRQTNSEAPSTYADYIQSLSYRQISASVVDIAITVGTDRSDEDFVDNGGVRRFSLNERVQMRNLKL